MVSGFYITFFSVSQRNFCGECFFRGWARKSKKSFNLCMSSSQASAFFFITFVRNVQVHPSPWKYQQITSYPLFAYSTFNGKPTRVGLAWSSPFGPKRIRRTASSYCIVVYTCQTSQQTPTTTSSIRKWSILY